LFFTCSKWSSIGGFAFAGFFLIVFPLSFEEGYIFPNWWMCPERGMLLRNGKKDKKQEFSTLYFTFSPGRRFF